MVAQVHPDCINASNPYHECTDYCFRKIAERKSTPGGSSLGAEKEVFADLPKEFGRKQQPKKRRETADSYGTTRVEEELDDEEEEDKPLPNVFARPIDVTSKKKIAGKGGGVVDVTTREEQGQEDEEEDLRPSAQGDAGDDAALGHDAPSYENMSERQKKLFDLRLKMNQARKANQTAVVAEKKREQRADAPQESRGMSKEKWYEERQKRMGKVLEANGLDMSRAYMLDTQQAAEEKYKKREKKEASFGWDVFNQKSLYKAYKKRTENVTVDMDDYERQKESDPNFYRDSSCLEYGKAPDIPEENVDRMVAELTERGNKRKEFSRRRRYHEEKDVDSINERNEHFNRKIERAFGKYTAEIKNNLERGTALPD